MSHFFTIFGDEALGDLLVRLDDEDAADILEGISPDDATDISTDVEPTVGQGTIVQVEPADVAEIRELSGPSAGNRRRDYEPGVRCDLTRRTRRSRRRRAELHTGAYASEPSG